MIGFVRYITSFIVFTIWYGVQMVGSALIRVKHRSGGIYDEAARRWAGWMLWGTGIRVRVDGRERLDPTVSRVYVVNHTSFLDIWSILAEFPGTIRFVYKKGMDWIPMMGQSMRAARHIPIDRNNRSAAFAAYNEAATYIRDGTSAVVFPEGTRSLDGLLKPFKKGPFVLAIAAGVPVVPVFCEHAYDLMPRGSWSPKPGTITLKIGEPISTAGLDVEARDALARESRAALLRMGARE